LARRSRRSHPPSRRRPPTARHSETSRAAPAESRRSGRPRRARPRSQRGRPPSLGIVPAHGQRPGSHHGDRVEDRVPSRPVGRRRRHAGHPGVDEDGDARRGRGRWHRQRDHLRGGSVGLGGRHARRPRVVAVAQRELASGKLVLDDPADHVVRVRISNPEKRGALDHEILDTLAHLVGDLDARCLVITGDGSMFSAGYDIGNLDEQNFAEQSEALVAHPFHDALEALEAFEYPVIASLNGHAIGGGLELALTADIRVAASGIKLGMPPAKLGLIYSHTGLKKFLDTIGVANTNELFYTGRNIDSERAAEIGLVNHVVEPDALEAATLDLAAEIASNAPISLRGNKRIIRALRDVPSQLPEDLERELIELRESCFFTEDFREGVRAFGEKRKPEWKNR